MKTEIRKPNTKTPKLRRKTVGQKVWPRGLPRLPAPRTRGSPALPENKRNGRARKLRADARWRQFTQAEQDHIREIFEQDGQEAAAAYCRKIHKYWSGSSISRFFHGERAGGSSPDVTRHTKLRLDSGWWQFTDQEQDKIRKIFERDGQMKAAEYCRNIGKPWSHTAISRVFAKERAARRAEDVEMRQRLARLKKITAAYARAGMGITEATAFHLVAKLRDAVESPAANPKTPKGRAIITKAAPYLIALRALELRREFKRKEVGLAERRVAVLEKKLGEALPKNAEPKTDKHVIEPSDELTEALGRAMFGDEWDDAPPNSDGDQDDQSDPIKPNQTSSQKSGAQGGVEPNDTVNTETETGTGDTPKQT